MRSSGCLRKIAQKPSISKIWILLTGMLMMTTLEDGRAFEPDFLMFANDKKTGNVSWQIFIEPKGGQFFDSDNTFENSKEGWKQKFLLQISERDEARTLVDDDRYRIIGLPFYNHTVSEELVKEELRGL